MRGGTSHGPFFRASDLPSDIATRDRVLLAAATPPDFEKPVIAENDLIAINYTSGTTYSLSRVVGDRLRCAPWRPS